MSSRESLEAAEREWEQRAGEQWGRVNRAEAEVKKLRAALERIAEKWCENYYEPTSCRDFYTDPTPSLLCGACVAREALKESSDG